MSGDSSAPTPSADALDNLSLSSPPGAMTRPRPEDVQEGTRLVTALRRAMNRPGQGSSKQLIRSTDHIVLLGDAAGSSSSAIVQEKADDEEGAEGEEASAAEASTSASPDSASHRTLTSWKTNEFAYRKVSSVGLGEEDELPTLARGLFTEGVGRREHRIVVRGYDKFFNVGEMPWTKPEAISAYSTGPYTLSFKENGCIIFIAALTPDQLVVTSKHSLGSRDGVEISHARKGEEWLERHLARAGRSKSELARELWRRDETAVAELCDDSFEEHVLAYPPERSGLHLHGLNRNAIDFSTRNMAEVEQFAKAWGFLPTRYIELATLAEVDSFTARCAETGTFEGEAIEGFVVRTHVASAPVASTSGAAAVAPPYSPGQAWFYKVKFDEPYLMYRDWRELTRKMLADKEKWEEQRSKTGEVVVEPAQPSEAKPQETSSIETPAEAPEKSKKQLKKELKKAAAAAAKATAAAQKGADGLPVPPPPDLPRNKRPETKLYVDWCHEQLYGSADGKVRARPELFSRFSEGKGIIALRQVFLRFLETPEGQRRFAVLGGQTKEASREEEEARRKAAEERAALPFTHTLIVPIAVPGCGKTALGVALSDLFNLSHTQADNVTNKRTGPQFLRNVAAELEGHERIFADRNNHLAKHRSELVEVCRAFEKPPPPSKGKKGKQGPPQQTAAAEAPKRRVRLVALAWKLDALSLNGVHRICSDRIVARGSNHQSLRAGEDHDAILWRFLETLEPFGSSVDQGEGDVADAHFDETIWLELEEDLDKGLQRAIRGLLPILGESMPSEERIAQALERARGYRATVQKEAKSIASKSAAEASTETRYFGIAVELDVVKTLEPLLEQRAEKSEEHAQALKMLHHLAKRNRVTARPHVTLVHRSALPSQGDTGEEGSAAPADEPAEVIKARRHLQAERQGARARWERYSELCKPGSGAIDFDISFDRLAWDERVMVLGVGYVGSEALPELLTLQGLESTKDGVERGQEEMAWRPHATLGTAGVEIRGVEANGVLRAADAGRKTTSPIEGIKTKVHLISFDEPIRARGRLAGMN